ncbi:response regulator transcription factor [Kocuria sp. JC486]|uniref:DNA-binding response regulator n=1 Tax=Kocuria soli TaxID=2485125 RepID=A0A3N3ZQ88_9MICC|nr:MULTISPECIES: response regulator transcription factor [Kocuria]NHU84966.1 response regulator transcription factor [Kocuria sp. JC486]ROZ63314.1 DNA-binding response regulator [Kocuria soli]
MTEALIPSTPSTPTSHPRVPGTTVVLADDHAAIRAGVRLILETAPEPFLVLGEAEKATEAVELTRALRPQVVLLDIRMPGPSGLSVIGQLREAGASVVVLTSFALDEYVMAALEAGADGFLVKSAEPQEIVAAVQRVAAGDAVLAPEVLRSVIARAVRPRDQAADAAPSQAADPNQVGTAVGEEEQAVQEMQEDRAVGFVPPGNLPDPLTHREQDVLALLARGLSNQQIARELVVAESTVKTHVSHVLAKLQVTSRIQAALWWGRHGHTR